MANNTNLGAAKTAKNDEFYFDERINEAVYARHNDEAQVHNVLSNSPLCAIGHDANRTCIYILSEMDADHLTVWSKEEQPTSTIVKCSVKLREINN